MRVRGLKLKFYQRQVASLRRTPCGCVDWNLHSRSYTKLLHVRRTPCGCVDWNLEVFGSETILASHPMRVRGLKLLSFIFTWYFNTSHPMWVRGLKLTETAELVVQSPLHPMQVRGLKLQSILCGRIQSVLLSCSYDLVIRWSMQKSNYTNTWYIVYFHCIAYLGFSVVNITRIIKTGAILSKIYS